MLKTKSYFLNKTDHQKDQLTKEPTEKLDDQLKEQPMSRTSDGPTDALKNEQT